MSPRPTTGSRRRILRPARRSTGMLVRSYLSIGSLTVAHRRSNLTSAIVTIVCGPEQRLFAAHEDVLCHSPFFAAACRGQFQEAHSRRIDLPDESPEIFSSVLEYLYKGMPMLAMPLAIGTPPPPRAQLELTEPLLSDQATIFPP